ncbi:alpha/beta fold hydrolase [Cryptosporangium aurantiacum]|uniref:Pimeloyl-ACP methyl ester carboxylesterase n=1 Tax=Cryptosporangium aurantiacum TaxID=134849 RepID=A0A1M7RN58_9ACTN|nr:alpha/beta fold hydrolase [Cryptosporangium aurantiacum]SHN47630.1 Pimeloyl-ACP methyl ester carboxylesterase [Cryptosporangium aurantiacum]
MTVTDIPQGRIEYRSAGPQASTEPPVVFVHGLLVNAELWTKVADALALDGVRSYAPDLPLGSHRIPLPVGTDLSPRGVARLINDFLAAHDLTDVTLVGNDTGGALCQFLIDTDHSRIGRLVLTNCDAFDQFPPAPFGLIFKAGRRPALLRALMASVRPKALRHSMLGFGGLVRDPLDPALTRRWITPALNDPAVRRNTADFLRHVDPKDLVDVSTRLHRFPKAARIVWGTADPFFKIGLARRLRDAFADATLVEIDRGRTFLPLDEPELVANEIRAAHALTA